MAGKSMSATDGTAFALHPQLAQDTVAIGELRLSRLLLNKDANYPWLLLVPRRPGITEIIDLDTEARARLMTEVADVSHALRDITQCDKLNVAALGNMVPQLHVHIIARRKGDVAWPRPVWGVAPAVAYGDNAQRTLIEAVRRKLGLDQNE
jgi:diadenosine tetraphosphate (Ap4A) HIT family hydrolase